jgi:hypothetical protein
VSFLEKSASELLLELTQEQQETVTGGGTYTETSQETEDSYYKKYEYTEQTVDKGKEENPFYRPLSYISPILGMTSMPRITFPRIGY